MKALKILVVIFTTILSMPASAQFGDILNRMKKEIEGAIQREPSQESPIETQSTPKQNTEASGQLQDTTQKDYRLNHILGTQPIWEVKYFADANDRLQRVYKSCGLNQSWERSLSVDYGDGRHASPEYWFNYVSKRGETLDNASKALFRGDDCKRNIDLAREFISSPAPLSLYAQYRRDVDDWRQAQQAERDRVVAERKAVEDRERLIEEKKKNEQDASIRKVLTDNNLEEVYRRDAFVIGRNRSGQLVYIKNGKIVKNAEVAADIAQYERVLAAQKDLEKIKQRNLSQKWFLNAQGVGHCAVSGISNSGRGDDGSAIFQVQHSCRRPGASGGSSGVSVVRCGFNHPSTYSSTVISARCQ